MPETLIRSGQDTHNKFRQIGWVANSHSKWAISNYPWLWHNS